MSASPARRRNDDPRAVTNNQRSRDSSVISSWGRASAMAEYGPASPTSRNGSTAIEGRADSSACCPAGNSAGGGSASGTARATLTSATKRKPWPWIVRMNRCDWPSSPSACRADLMRLASAASDTTRPSQTLSRSSFRETRRSRFSTSRVSSARTCGSTGRTRPRRAALPWPCRVRKCRTGRAWARGYRRPAQSPTNLPQISLKSP